MLSFVAVPPASAALLPPSRSRHAAAAAARHRVPLRLRTTPRAAWADERLKPMPSIIPPTDDYDWAKFPGVALEAPLKLDIHDMLALAKGETPDEYPTEIVLTLLGWQRTADGKWDNSLTRPAWRESYPDLPPNFIGDRNNYSREVDLPVKQAVQRLQRSVHQEHKVRSQCGA